jgi:type I restriction enzyme S subunit
MSYDTLALGEACSVITDGTHYTPKAQEHGRPFLTVKDMLDGCLDFENCSRISEGDFQDAIRNGCGPRAGDVLFSKDGTVGKVHPFTLEEDCAVLSSIAILRPKTEILAQSYFAHFLRSEAFLRKALRNKTGSAIRRIILANLRNLEIPLPPLEEQRRIAAILDKAGNLRQHANGQLCQAKDLLASLFIETIGEPCQNPHDWSTLPLAEAVQSGTDVTYGIVQAGEEFPGGIPYIRTGDIVDGEIDVSALRHTDPAIASRFIRSTVRTGEIIMSIRATVGTTAIVPTCLDGANLTQGTARVAPGKNVNGVYLLQYLRMPSTQAWIQRQVKGATFREITLARLRELPVLIPPMGIQDKFAAKAMLANSAIDSSKVLLSRIENLSLSLRNQLLARK